MRGLHAPREGALIERGVDVRLNEIGLRRRAIGELSDFDFAKTAAGSTPE
jgi:hypothetical protein